MSLVDDIVLDLCYSKRLSDSYNAKQAAQAQSEEIEQQILNARHQIRQMQVWVHHEEIVKLRRGNRRRELFSHIKSYASRFLRPITNLRHVLFGVTPEWEQF